MPEGLMSADREKVQRAAEWSIGIDFGTAFSKAAAARVVEGTNATMREVRPLRIGAAAGWDRPFLAPSSMYLDRERIYFGPHAARRLHEQDAEGRELLRSFKMILGSSDFTNALDYIPPASVDPDGAFRRRELIILYLGYLLALIDAAASPVLCPTGDASSRCHLRYSRPAWMPDRFAAAHALMSKLFEQGKFVRDQLGQQLLAPSGVDYATARIAVDRAVAGATGFENLDGGVFEASAVGVCHYSDPTAPNYMVILDIGAGTTDVTGLLREPYKGSVRVVRAARHTIDVAGDSFDAALMHLFLAKGKQFSTRSERTALWRSLLPHVRDLKEELFATGAVAIKFRGATISCTAQELAAHPQFKGAFSAIKTFYLKSLREVAKVGRKDGARTIGIVLAGGGSRLPMVQKMVMERRWLGFGVTLQHMPSSPKWANQLGSGEEWENMFAQLSVAFGAAISGREQFNSQPI